MGRCKLQRIAVASRSDVARVAAQPALAGKATSSGQNKPPASAGGHVDSVLLERVTAHIAAQFRQRGPAAGHDSVNDLDHRFGARSMHERAVAREPRLQDPSVSGGRRVYQRSRRGVPVTANSVTLRSVGRCTTAAAWRRAVGPSAGLCGSIVAGPYRRRRRAFPPGGQVPGRGRGRKGSARKLAATRP